MIMNKLELKHIIGYLPYGLKMTRNDKNFGILYALNNKYNKADINFEFGYDRYDIEDLKPALRPISDLHKKVDGKIHLLELYAMASMGVYDNNFTISEDGVLDDSRNKMRVRWVKDVNKLYIDDYYKGKGGYYTVSIEIIEYLYKNHFDIYGLIEQNLAIKINTL